MATPPSRDHRITLDAAAAHTRRFREANPDKGTEKAAMFWRAGGLDELLGQKGCAGLRMYFGRNQDGVNAMVLVGVDANGNDLFGGTVLEEHLPCPPWCSAANPLGG